MKTLEQIKNDYAVSVGFEDWKQLIKNIILSNRLDNAFDKIDYITEKISIESQKECLKRASEKTSEQYVRPITLNYQEIKDLITNENNIVK